MERGKAVTAHELAKKLLEGQDLAVAYRNWDDFDPCPTPIGVSELEVTNGNFTDLNDSGKLVSGEFIYLQ